MQADLDEAVAELKNSEERSKKAGEFFFFNRYLKKKFFS